MVKVIFAQRSDRMIPKKRGGGDLFFKQGSREYALSIKAFLQTEYRIILSQEE